MYKIVVTGSAGFIAPHIIEEALIKVALDGRVGESYCIGSNQEKTNEEIVEMICEILDLHSKLNAPHNKLKVYVEDRLGHDRRYAINSKKIRDELNWYPKYDFKDAISSTVIWYLKNFNWCSKSIK